MSNKLVKNNKKHQNLSISVTESQIKSWKKVSDAPKEIVNIIRKVNPSAKVFTEASLKALRKRNDAEKAFSIRCGATKDGKIKVSTLSYFHENTECGCLFSIDKLCKDVILRKLSDTENYNPIEAFNKDHPEYSYTASGINSQYRSEIIVDSDDPVKAVKFKSIITDSNFPPNHIRTNPENGHVQFFWLLNQNIRIKDRFYNSIKETWNLYTNAYREANKVYGDKNYTGFKAQNPYALDRPSEHITNKLYDINDLTSFFHSINEKATEEDKTESKKAKVDSILKKATASSLYVALSKKTLEDAGIKVIPDILDITIDLKKAEANSECASYSYNDITNFSKNYSRLGSRYSAIFATVAAKCNGIFQRAIIHNPQCKPISVITTSVRNSIISYIVDEYSKNSAIFLKDNEYPLEVALKRTNDSINYCIKHFDIKKAGYTEEQRKLSLESRKLESFSSKFKVINLYLKGISIKEISNSLGISIKTVRKYIKDLKDIDSENQMTIINSLESEFNMFISNIFNVVSKKFKHVKKLIIDKIFKVISKIKNYLYSLITQTIKNTDLSIININNKVPLANAYSGGFADNYIKKIVDTLLE